MIGLLMNMKNLLPWLWFDFHLAHTFGPYLFGNINKSRVILFVADSLVDYLNHFGSPAAGFPVHVRQLQLWLVYHSCSPSHGPHCTDE